jgi:septum formation protein
MKINNYQILLASGSPRRQQFLKEMGLDFQLQVRPINEIYPASLEGQEIAEYLARSKAAAFPDLKEHQLLITADTIVWFENRVLEKPTHHQEAIQMLQQLSGNTHTVYSSVCLTTTQKQLLRCDQTQVWFKNLTAAEITYYVENYQPFDKAGGYGIQEWIGAIGVSRIEGSYNTVMGLPTHLLYEMLIELDKP